MHICVTTLHRYPSRCRFEIWCPGHNIGRGVATPSSVKCYGKCKSHTTFGLAEVHADGKDLGESRSSLAPDLSRRVRRHARALGVSAASVFHVAWDRCWHEPPGRTTRCSAP